MARVSAGLALLVGRSHSEPTVRSGRSPAWLTRPSAKTAHFQHVVAHGAISLYSIDHANRLIQTISLPQIDSSVHGVVASLRTAKLYIAYGQQKPPGGALLAYDLRHGRTPRTRTHCLGAPSDGNFSGRFIAGSTDAHNTIMGPDDRYLYAGGVDHPYLEVASTTTNQVVRKFGHLNGPGVRRFHDQREPRLASDRPTRALPLRRRPGNVNDIRTNNVVAHRPVIASTGDFLEIDWRLRGAPPPRLTAARISVVVACNWEC